MMKRLLLFLIFSSAAFGQHLWTGVLDPSRAIDWTNAGAPNINETRTQCVTTACATVSGGSVTAASINAALASASAHTYVLIPSGTYTISTGITFSNRSNITLRGSGSNKTFLVWSSSSGGPGNCGGHDVCASSSDTNYAGGPSNTANWSAGYTQGATSITLSNTGGLAVGAPLILDQVDTQSDNGALYVGCEISDGSSNCYNGTAPNGFSRGQGSLSTIRGQQQIVTVTSISGNTVGISPGLYAANWALGNSPGAWWASNPVQGDAVENISLDHTNGGDGITFFNCQGCWVKGIRSVRSSTTGTAWGHVYWSICNRCTVRDSYFYGYTGDTYGVSVEIASDSLAENNMFQFPSASQFYNSDCEGCVAGYNFSVASLFGNSANWLGNSSEFHGVDLYSLAEGNVGSGYYGDSFHGTHDLNTDFRNRWDGREQNAGNATTSNTVALRMNPGNRYQNVIGNVLGTIGYHTTYKSSPSATGNQLYLSVIGCGAYPEAGMAGDSLSCSTSMFWGNWDNVHNAVQWNSSEVPTGLSSYSNSVPASHTLPASFYYSTKPSWWPSGKAWPAIGPDVTGGNVGQCSGGSEDSNEAISSSVCSGGTMTPLATVNSNPAMDCYFNVMHGPADGTGSALAFDSSSCFAALNSTSTSLSSSNSAPTPGTNITLTATVTPSSGPTGSVTFFDGGVSIGTAVLPALTHTVTAITAGTHIYTAIYGGDSIYSSSSSSPVTVTAASSGGGTAPTFSPGTGIYSSPVSITVSSTNPLIFYTRDGTTPRLTSTPYTSPISISSNTTLEAISAAGGQVRQNMQASLTGGGRKLCAPQLGGPGTPLATCTGGVGTAQPSDWLVSTDGTTMFYSVTSTSGAPQILVTLGGFGCDTCTTETQHFRIEPVANVHMENIEVDMWHNDGTHNRLHMFGLQCNQQSAFLQWQVDNEQGSWQNTGIKDNCPMTAGVYTDVVLEGHWVIGDTGCGGLGCTVFDNLYINGVKHAINMSLESDNPGWSAGCANQKQLDLRPGGTVSAPFTASENIQEDDVTCAQGVSATSNAVYTFQTLNPVINFGGHIQLSGQIQVQ